MKPFSNSNLNLFLETRFNKKIDRITEEELDQVEVLAINYINLFGFKETFDFDLLKSFSNLKELNVNNFTLSKSDIEFLSNLTIKSITFNKCSFDDESLSLLKNVEELGFNNCYFEDFNFFKVFTNLKKLILNNPFTKIALDVSNIVNNSLEMLVLQNCKLLNIKSLEQIKSCKYLSLLWTDFDDESLAFLNSMSNLEELFISSVFNECEIIQSLKEKISIKHDLIDYGFELEEKESNINVLH